MWRILSLEGVYVLLHFETKLHIVEEIAKFGTQENFQKH